ncbi:MAG: nuclear transport factor 2 family protein [Streptosporangiaceae bacterium]
MTHPNEDLLRGGYQAFAEGDMNTVLSVLADDIVWHVGGSSQVTGDYRGHQEVMGFFGQLGQLTGGSFRLEIHDILANDTHGVALVTAHGQRDGQDYAIREANIWHLSGGKATEFWSFTDDEPGLDRLLG